MFTGMTTLDNHYLNFDNAIIGCYHCTNKNISTTCGSASVATSIFEQLKGNPDFTLQSIKGNGR